MPPGFYFLPAIGAMIYRTLMDLIFIFPVRASKKIDPKNNQCNQSPGDNQE
jgi:hypothetical protein